MISTQTVRNHPFFPPLPARTVNFASVSDFLSQVKTGRGRLIVQPGQTFSIPLPRGATASLEGLDPKRFAWRQENGKLLITAQNDAPLGVGDRMKLGLSSIAARFRQVTFTLVPDRPLYALGAVPKS